MFEKRILYYTVIQRVHALLYKLIEEVKKFFQSQGGAALRFSSPYPNTSLYCETTDVGLVHRVVCLFTSQPLDQYQIIMPGDKGT